MIKVGVDVTWLPHDQRGMGRFVRSIIEVLRTEPEVALTYTSRRPQETRLGPVLGQDVPVLGWKNPGLEGLDVCWYPWNRIDVPAPTRRVVTIHDTGAVDWPVPGRLAFLDNRKARRMLEQAVARAHRVMTVSQFTKGRIESLFRPAAVDVVSEGVSADGPVEPVPVSRPFVLYVGAVEPRKNVAGLLEAWARLVAEGRVGDRVLALRADPPLPPGPQVVSITGVSEAGLRWLYRNCDAFVMPSFYEGFGLPLLEAMAAGAPVASSREASLPEVGGKVPEYFDPRNIEDMAAAIERTLNDSERIERMRSAGPKQAGLFTWERAALLVLESLFATAEMAGV
ncbi:MAG TPA: glycosyltransferase family 1 protein [Candidatus Xenobia bacterium]